METTDNFSGPSTTTTTDNLAGPSTSTSTSTGNFPGRSTTTTADNLPGRSTATTTTPNHRVRPLPPANPAALEGVDLPGIGGGVGRRPGRRWWLGFRRAVVGWSGFLAVAFSIAGWS
ncbi:hypothetical protein B0T16DRAFT_486908 [Cercophora newfieldiana]|uniref:Uncharacterized protein n=1 Tax=Cercophora newfieldiana TaxID=92897 RepID=A0AA39YML0_9PEZI|nr:hypothetical protein B0T16DRAFT_486908 [Cercophora newfieldiana]